MASRQCLFAYDDRGAIQNADKQQVSQVPSGMHLNSLDGPLRESSTSMQHCAGESADCSQPAVICTATDDRGHDQGRLQQAGIR